jgi:hypothetical protein
VRSTTFLFTTLCTSIQLFGEKHSQSRVDWLKTSAAELQSAAGAPGTLPAKSAPRAVLRQSRPPRCACGSSPTASRSGPRSPSRLPSLEREPSLLRRTAPYCQAVRRLSSCQARLPRSARTPRQPAHTAAPAVPAFKGRRTAGSRTPLHAVVLSSCPFPSTTPSLVFLAAVQCPLAVPHSSPTSPAPPHPSPRPEPHRTEPHRGRASWAPPAGLAQAIFHPSAATNRSMVSPSTSSTHSPAKGATGVAQFRRATPAGLPRDHIAKQKFFPRASLRKGNSNSKSALAVSCKLHIKS